MKSSDLSAKTNEASQIVGSFGGYAQSVRYQATHQGDGEAVLDAPCPGAERAGGDREARRPRHAPLAAGLDPGPAGEGDAPDERDRLAAARDRRLRDGAPEHDAARDPAGRPADQARTTRAARSPGCGTRAPAPSRRPRPRTSRCCSRRTTTQSSRPAHHGGSTRIGRLLGSAAHFLALEGIIVLYALIVLAPLLLLGGARLVDPARAAAARESGCSRPPRERPGGTVAVVAGPR